MKVLVTGATGLIGTEIVALLLQNGIKVNYLTTSKEKIEHQPNYNGFYWNPQSGIIDENCFIGVFAVIHLAGASISKKWTSKYKQEIIESRVLSSNLLYSVLKNKPHQVKKFISASAIGIYPDSLTEVYTEDFTRFNNSFLSNVVVKWEESVRQIERLKIDVCYLRTGLVLSTKGGALAEIIKPTQLGLGAAFGSGKQMQSWIHIHDLANMYLFAIQNDISGVFNGVAPMPISNYELTSSIAKSLNKPFFLPNIPKFILKLVLGEMHTILFESQNVSANKIVKHGFSFEFKTIYSALQNLIKK